MCISNYFSKHSPIKKCVFCKQFYFKTKDSCICKKCFDILNVRLFNTEYNEYGVAKKY